MTLDDRTRIRVLLQVGVLAKFEEYVRVTKGSRAWRGRQSGPSSPRSREMATVQSGNNPRTIPVEQDLTLHEFA